MDASHEVNVSTEEGTELTAAASAENPEHNENKTAEKTRLVKLPLARVRTIMKLDPDCKLISQDAVLLIAKATELFIEAITKASYECTLQTKRKTVQKQDFDKVVKTAANLCFMDGMLD